MKLDVVKAYYPGFISAAMVGLAATFLARNYNAPVMLFALLIGMAFNFLHEDGRCKQGIDFASRTVLRLGVALLGLRITFTQISTLGLVPIITVIAGVATTSLFGLWLGRRLGLGSYFGLLSGGAVAICGASAALAISTSLPRYETKERDTALTVVGVTTLSTIAMILYPLVVSLLQLNATEAGVFIGGTIHDVAQVVGAGYMVSQETGDVSTYVKLLRVAALVPVVVLISFLMSEGAGTGDRIRRAFPMFLVGFCALVIFNSVLSIPAQVTSAATTLSSYCLVTAISALGMKTSFRSLVEVGWRPVGMMVAETLWIALLVLGAIFLTR
jgi:uncharacterized integral membrane protein (TIGR00698 family)